jgi:hypothetical protein
MFAVDVKTNLVPIDPLGSNDEVATTDVPYVRLYNFVLPSWPSALINNEFLANAIVDPKCSKLTGCGLTIESISW